MSSSASPEHWRSSCRSARVHRPQEEDLQHLEYHPDNSHQAANQHVVTFTDGPRSVNEPVAPDFDQRKNPVDYDPSERE